MVANLSDEERLTYRVNYTNINMRDVDIEDIITLANMKLALPSSITISGYIHCSSSYTSEQIKLIKDAFGEDAFLLSNLISFDCNSDQIIISATGEGVQVIDETTIEVLQGTEAQFSATGFPIIEAVTPTYE